MRALAVACSLIVLVLAGCAGNEERDTPPAPPARNEIPEFATVFGPGASLSNSTAGAGTGSAGTGNVTIGIPQNFTTGFRGAEPNMGVTSSGAVFASVGSTIIRSVDRGVTWEPVHTHMLLNSDPMMWVDPWTDCVYNAPMFPTLLAATLYVSCDDGESWTPVHSQNVGRGVYDHQKLASALPGPDAPPAAGLLHPTVLIICYNALVATQCAVSFDGGLTWPHDVPVWSDAQGPPCAGQQSHPTGAPDGTIVVAKAWGCADPLVFVSRDSGLTWTQRPGPPGIGGDTLDPEIAFTTDGTMYMLWQSRRGEDHAYLARSPDQGVTWDGVWNVTPPGLGSSIFASLHAGSPGHVAMAFHATNYTEYPSEIPDDARWHTYIVTSTDADTAAPTFVGLRVQPVEDPVQVGSICNGNQGCHDGNRNLLDFIDGGVGPDGTFYTVIADGCVDGCAGDPDATPADSRDRQAVMLRLDGFSLYAPGETGMPKPVG